MGKKKKRPDGLFTRCVNTLANNFQPRIFSLRDRQLWECTNTSADKELPALLVSKAKGSLVAEMLL